MSYVILFSFQQSPMKIFILERRSLDRINIIFVSLGRGELEILKIYISQPSYRGVFNMAKYNVGEKYD